MRGDRFTFNLANSSFNALKQAKSDQTFQVQISWRCNEDQTQHTHTSTDMQYTYFPNANYEHTPIPPICKSYYLNVRKLSEPIGAQNTRWAHTLCFVMVFAVYGTFLVIPTTQSHTRFQTATCKAPPAHQKRWPFTHTDGRATGCSSVVQVCCPMTLFTWRLKGPGITAPIRLVTALSATHPMTEHQLAIALNIV